MSAVFDASTVLAILFEERGADVAVAVSKGALLSTVNLVEVIEKFVSKGGTPAQVVAHLRRLEIAIMPFGTRQTSSAADLKPIVKGLDISPIASVWRWRSAADCRSGPRIEIGPNSTSGSRYG